MKTDLKETGCEDVDWNQLAQNRDQWWVPVNTVMIFGFHEGCVISSLAGQLIASPKRILLHGVSSLRFYFFVHGVFILANLTTSRDITIRTVFLCSFKYTSYWCQRYGLYVFNGTNVK